MDSADDTNGGRRQSSTFQGRLRWSKEMEQLIIELWEENIMDYFGPRKRSSIYKDMAECITEAGFAVEWTDVRNKLENLTRKYKAEKDKVQASPGSPSRWRYFEKMHSFLSTDSRRKRVKQERIKAEEDEDEFESLDDVEIDQDTQSELLDIAREQLQIQREEQIANREHRRTQLKVLKYIARSQDKLQSLLVQFLTDTDNNE